MTVKLLTEHHLEFLSLKEAPQARLSRLNLSKCHIVKIICHVSFLFCLYIDELTEGTNSMHKFESIDSSILYKGDTRSEMKLGAIPWIIL